MSLRLLIALCATCNALVVRPPLHTTAAAAARAGTPVAGLLDGMFKESDAQKRQKEEQLAAMKAMQQKRRDPITAELERKRRRNVELATRAAAVGNLPTGWGSAIDPASGARYFFDEETKETTWDPPIQEMVALLEEQQRSELEALIKEV